MKKIILFIILISLSNIPISEAKERPLHITSMIIQFNKSDAILTANYDFDPISKTYIMVFGGKALEPKIKSLFSNFDYEIIKIDQGQSILKMKGISRWDKGYYLHTPIKFGEKVDSLYVITTSSYPKTYFNVESTPYIFYR